MTPAHISKRTVVDRLAHVDEALRDIRALPLNDQSTFLADRRNIWTAESCLRRSLEALLDLGRHILAKGFGLGVSEYKEVATRLRDQGVLTVQEADLLRTLVGYRNRMVHFYHEVTAEELYGICLNRLDEVEQIADAYRRWVATHPEKLDQAL